jgi:hypothetical protein
MLLIGMGAATVVVVRMVAMKEENGLYHRRPQMDNWSLRPRMTGDVNRAWSDAQRSRLFGWPGLGNQVVIPRTNSLWAGATRWRSLNGGMPKGVVLLAVMMFAGTLSGIRNAQANVGAALPLCIWLSIVPASAAGQLWMRQWRFLEIELLRPIERRRFLQQVGLAMGVTFAQCWCVFAAAFVLRLGILTPEPLNVTTILLVLGSSLLMQIFLLGSIIWLMRYRSPGLVIGASLLAILIALPTLILTLPGGMMGMPHFGEFQMPAVVAATVLAGIGLVITRDACRRWLVTELG